MAESSFEWEDAFERSRREISLLTVGYRLAIEDALKELTEDDSQLALAAAKALSSGGKRLRPILTLLVCEAATGSFQKGIPSAICYELAHVASLIQDDIVDDSAVRHNAPSVYSKYGSIRAIMVSDYLIFDIFSQLAKYDKLKISSSQMADLLSYLSNAAKMAAKGEFADILLATKGGATEEEYVDMIGYKTSALFAGAAASGAVIGGCPKRIVNAAFNFGFNFGLSFQVVDDIIDIVGDSRSTGKPVLKDVQNQASNIVVLHALSKLDPEGKKEITSLSWRRNFTPGDAARLLEIFQKTDSLHYASNLAKRYVDLSRASLLDFSHSEARAKLDKLSKALVIGLA